MKIVQSLLDCIEYINGIISDFKEFYPLSQAFFNAFFESSVACKPSASS